MADGFDVSGQADEIARLGVQVTQSGVEQTTAALNTMAAAGEKSEQGFKRTGEASRVLSAQLTALSQVTHNIGAANTEARSAAEGLARGLREQADAGHLSATQLSQLIAAEKDLAGVTTAAHASASAARSSMEAFGGSNLRAAEAAEHHSISLGRVERSLESFIVRATGANEQLGLLTAAFGHLELGSVVMIGLLGGIFAVAKGYELLTGNAREAAKASEEFAKSTEGRQATTTGLGLIGVNPSHIPALSEEAKKASDAVADLQHRLAGFANGPERNAGNVIAGGPSSLVRTLATDLLVGKKNVDELASSIQALKGTPAITEEDLRKTVEWGERLIAAREHLDELNATLNQTRAVTAYYREQIGALSVDEGQLIEKTTERQRVLAAFQQGGPVAGHRAEDNLAALDAARSAYTEIAKSGQNAEAATVAFQNALTQTSGPAHDLAQRLLDEQRAYIQLGRTIADTQNQQRSGAEADTRLSSLSDQIQRLGDEAANFGKDGSLQSRIAGLDDQLSEFVQHLGQQAATGKLSSASFEQQAAAVEALRQRLYEAGAALRDAYAVQVTQQIHEQNVAQTQLFNALVSGKGAYQELSAARAADLEIAQRQRELGRDLSQAAQQEIRDTHEKAAAIEQAHAASTIRDESAAVAAEIAAIQSGKSTRVSYQADLAYENRLRTASHITNAQVRQDYLDAADAAHKNGTALAELKQLNALIGEETGQSFARSLEHSIEELVERQRKYVQDISRIWSDGFERIVTDGTKSFHDFFEDTLQLGSRLIKRMQDEGKDEGLGYNALRYGSAAITGGLAGYQLGERIGSNGWSALAGAGSGAITGAEIGGVPGAVIGGLAGAAGGLLGAAEAHKQAARDLQNAAKAFATNLAQYSASNSVQSAVTENNAKAEQLRNQADDLLRQRLKAANVGGVSTDEAADVFGQYATDLAGITRAQAENAKKIADEFWASIRQGLNSLNGPAGAYQNALDQIEQAYRDNVASVLALHSPIHDLAGLQTGLAQVEELRARQEAALRAAEDERLVQAKLSLDAREAYAKGLTAEGDALTRRAEEERQRFQAEQEGWSSADKARQIYIQGLEDERAALKALQDAQTALLGAIASGPNGTSAIALAATLAPLRAQLAADQQESANAYGKLLNDIATGKDAVTLYTDGQAALTAATKVAGDQAQITAAEFQAAAAAMRQTQSDIQRDISLGFKTPGQGREAEANAFFGPGGSSLTNDQIRALYTPFTGQPLTNAQEETNKNIETFFKDFPEAVAQAIAGLSGSNAPQGQREALTNAAQAETEATGNRLADYTASMLGEIRFIRADVHTIAGGASLRPDLAGSELARFIGRLTPATPSGFAALNTLPALAETPRTAGAPGMTIQVSAPITVRVVAPDGSDARQLSADLERALEPKIEDLIYRAIRAAQRKAGDTTIPV